MSLRNLVDWKTVGGVVLGAYIVAVISAVIPAASPGGLAAKISKPSA